MGKTYFVSGHRNITEEEFIEHYEPILWEKLNEEGAIFVVGDCAGVDDMAQKYLKAFDIRDITVYHMFEEPRHGNGLPTNGGYRSDVERDFAMTVASDEDIAWVRPGCERSGTAQNIERRSWLKERVENGLPVTLEDLNRRESKNFL